MAICRSCNQEMLTADGCTIVTTNVNNKNMPRIAYGSETGAEHWKHDRCHDCGATWGQQHHPGCDMEQCPVCGRQFISCDCIVQDELPTVTPGPWRVIGDESYTIRAPDIDEIVVWEMGGIDNQANAHLIAAAPELLSACEALLRWYDALPSEDEDAADERTAWVGMCETEALLQDDDDLYVTADDPELAAIVADARAAVRKARGES